MSAALDVMAVLAASTMFASAAIAQSARDMRGPSPLVAIENEPPGGIDVGEVGRNSETLSVQNPLSGDHRSGQRQSIHDAQRDADRHHDARNDGVFGLAEGRREYRRRGLHQVCKGGEYVFRCGGRHGKCRI